MTRTNAGLPARRRGVRRTEASPHRPADLRTVLHTTVQFAEQEFLSLELPGPDTFVADTLAVLAPRALHPAGAARHAEHASESSSIVPAGRRPCRSGNRACLGSLREERAPGRACATGPRLCGTTACGRSVEAKSDLATGRSDRRRASRASWSRAPVRNRGGVGRPVMVGTRAEAADACPRSYRSQHGNRTCDVEVPRGTRASQRTRCAPGRSPPGGRHPHRAPRGQRETSRTDRPSTACRGWSADDIERRLAVATSRRPMIGGVSSGAASKGAGTARGSPVRCFIARRLGPRAGLLSVRNVRAVSTALVEDWR